jgi:DNA invertase Pin-like site-specific DNA recombinase
VRSIANFVALSDELPPVKVVLACTNQLIGTTTPRERLEQNILLAFAEYEREIVREGVKERTALEEYFSKNKAFNLKRLRDR